MKILITGSEGYIGKHLVKKLYNILDIECIDIIDIKKGLDIRIPIQSHKEYDVLIHLAALTSVSESTKIPEDYFITNVNGTINLLHNVKFKHFIFASTGAVENLANPYALSKKMAELVIEKYCNTNNKNYTIFRFYNVIGYDECPPTNTDSLFANLINAEKTGTFYIFGNNYNTKDGTCVRDYVHVNEICSSIVKALSEPSNSIENLGHGIGTSVQEMADLYQKANNCKFKIEIKDRRPGDIERSVLQNISKYMTKKYELIDVLKI